MGAAEKFTNLGLALSPLKARSGLVFGAELEFAAAIDLKRPYIRVDIRKAVEANTLRAKDGRFLDFNELTPIDAKYDLGHAYGHEFWRLKEYGQQQRMTQTQFNDYANNSKFYQIESPAFNRSHKYEKPR